MLQPVQGSFRDNEQHDIDSKARGGPVRDRPHGDQVRSGRGAHRHHGTHPRAVGEGRLAAGLHGSTLLAAFGANQSDAHIVVMLGGVTDGNQKTVLGSIEACRPNLGSGPGDWALDAVSMRPRWLHNTVLLPDGRVFIVGGEDVFTMFEGCAQSPVFTPEMYDRTQPASGQRIRDLASHAPIIRDYHSTAVLLPTGEIITGGGEFRHKAACTCPCVAPNTVFDSDYQIYRPDYITSATSSVFNRPVITPPQLGSEFLFPYGDQIDVYYTMPGGTDAVISQVVLTRPGSVTHHADTNQRCVRLNFTPLAIGGQSLVRVTMPTKASGILPRGYYMLWLVTNQTVTTQGVPSVAAWVRVI